MNGHKSSVTVCFYFILFYISPSSTVLFFFQGVFNEEETVACLETKVIYLIPGVRGEIKWPNNLTASTQSVCSEGGWRASLSPPANQSCLFHPLHSIVILQLLFYFLNSCGVLSEDCKSSNKTFLKPGFFIYLYVYSFYLFIYFACYYFLTLGMIFFSHCENCSFV